MAPLLRSLDLLPKGRSLPQHVWLRRHRSLLVLLWLHVTALTLLGLARGYDVGHVLLEVVVLVGGFAAVATLSGLGRKLRSLMVALGLLTSSALLVHFTGGLIESHFHFFLVVPLLTLYADWSVFLLAISYVAVHHGVFAQLDPTAVFNHPSAWRDPWKWALIHAGYVLGASGTALVAWRATEERALRDSLTQLPNAESFMEQAYRARARAQRRRERLGMIYLDLNGFKQVNDTLGHGAGDTVLMGVADRLRISLRDTDVAARLGGDEFAILLEDLPMDTAVAGVVARIEHALAQPFTVKGRSVSISASTGVVVSDPDRVERPEDLLREADAAMYEAKRDGRRPSRADHTPEAVAAS
ncbi:MAG TPA: GGDEF domain-containing protein [Actinomycetota bacterium]|nr:GGDEF domain-containing protein [Actinomycetota bacterium]